MSDKLTNHRKTVRFNMLLDGARNIGNSVANPGLINPFLQRALCYLKQKRNLWVNSSYRNSDCRISIKTFVVHAKIKRNNIALAQYFFSGRDPVHHLFIHRRA